MELLKKLKVTTDTPFWVIDAPDEVAALLEGIELKTNPGKIKDVAQLLLFVADSPALKLQLPKLSKCINHNTVFWICYPKKSGSISSDLIRNSTWDIVFDSGYRAQTSVSINNDWTALRVTNAPKKTTLADLPPEQRNIPGIDFVKRTVTLPEDAATALKAYSGMIEFFNSMAFTHKKEHVAAIEEAKKPETRTRRIQKMAEMLLNMMEAKELKAMRKKR